MNHNTYLAKLHAEILTIMDEIDRVCKKNRITYYIVGGTLLGAIRHGGFIPWDDDLDIAMSRSDMENFIEVAKKELNENFYLDWIDTNIHYRNIFPKICKKGTVFDEGKGSVFGIFVDIFPLDLTCAYKPELEMYKQKIKRYHYLTSTNSIHSFKSLFYFIAGHFFSKVYCYKKQSEIGKKAQMMGDSHYANFGSQYALKKQIMPVEWYGRGTSVMFENRYYHAPTEFRKVLSSIYGDNYMDIPPVEKRRSHYPKHVVFSDGSSIDFEEPQFKVKITDQ